jgi:prephenate dehydratase
MTRPRVTYQGEPGAFSEEAALSWFGDADCEPRTTFRQVAEAVVNGEADAGVLPVENTLAGGVASAYDVLGSLPLTVVGEVVRPIRMCLLGLRGAAVTGLRRVESHPVALAQCGIFLARHPTIEAVVVHDTAGAARLVAERGDPTVAAIASAWAAERYGLEVLAEGIQDRDDNRTRFFVVRRDEPASRSWNGPTPGPGTPWKTALLIETENRPGGLVSALLPLAERGVNLTHLEARPGGDPWTYRFFLDVSAPDQPTVDEALEAVARATSRFRVLGRFPAAPG